MGFVGNAGNPLDLPDYRYSHSRPIVWTVNLRWKNKRTLSYWGKPQVLLPAKANIWQTVISCLV